MKLALRAAAFTLVVAVAVAGNSLPAASTHAVVRRSVMPTNTPIPMCNPFEHTCPNIR